MTETIKRTAVTPEEVTEQAVAQYRTRSRLWLFLRNILAIVTGIYHCKTAEREIEEERIICETWLTEEPKGIYAFARINGKTYYRPGYFDASKNDWVVSDIEANSGTAAEPETKK